MATIRKIDNLGRITLPKHLRDEMYLHGDNAELEIFVAEIGGEKCICLKSTVKPVEEKLKAAARIFEICGVELTDEMKDKIAKDKN